ncbi:hypothetical protein [Yinghuangia aomiensis]|uniref:hypothetical protein n=1 Tax=Yinghuangia aomiensis TaxID=676205 RepID=UPI0031ED7AC2
MTLYVDRTGTPWEYLSHDYPPYKLRQAGCRRTRPEAQSESALGDQAAGEFEEGFVDVGASFPTDA